MSSSPPPEETHDSGAGRVVESPHKGKVFETNFSSSPFQSSTHDQQQQAHQQELSPLHAPEGSGLRHTPLQSPEHHTYGEAFTLGAGFIGGHHGSPLGGQPEQGHTGGNYLHDEQQRQPHSPQDQQLFTPSTDFSTIHAASSNIKVTPVIKLKCYHKHDIRAISISEGTSFRSLKQRLAQDYGFEVSLKYEDPDGDYITLSCQNDLNELFASVLEFKQRAVKVLVDVTGQEKDAGSQRVLLSPTPTASAATLNPLPTAGAGAIDLGESSTSLLADKHQTTTPVVVASNLSQASNHSSNFRGTCVATATLDDDCKLVEALPSDHLPNSAKLLQSLRSIPSEAEPDTNSTPSISTISRPPQNTAFHTNEDEPKIRWQRAELIGSGAFGRVYLGLNLDTGQLMAVKHLDMSEVSGKELKALENEVQTLKGLQHENIVQYLGCDFSHDDTKSGSDEKFSSEGAGDEMNDTASTNSSGMLSNHPGANSSASRIKGNFSIFLEYVSGGSVRSLLDKFGSLSEDLVKNYSRQILLGLEYLHHNGIAHRDIKAANMLITNDGVIKLADFGAAKRITRNTTTDLNLVLNSGDHSVVNNSGDAVEKDDAEKIMQLVRGQGGDNDSNNTNASLRSTRGAKGTPLWMAPEVIKETLARNGWKKADLWSVGCTVIEMATGKPPWSQYSNAVTAMYHIACMNDPPTFPENMSSDGRAFLDICFNRDPVKRGDVSSMIMHLWIMGFAGSGRGRNLRSKASSRYVASRGGNSNYGPLDAEPVRPSTSAGERLWTAGMGAERWERDKKERKKKESKESEKVAMSARAQEQIDSPLGDSIATQLKPPEKAEPTSSRLALMPPTTAVPTGAESRIYTSPEPNLAQKQRKSKSGSGKKKGKGKHRRSTSKTRGSAEVDKDKDKDKDKEWGRDKDDSDKKQSRHLTHRRNRSLSSETERDQQQLLSVMSSSPQPYEFSSPPEKKRPPKVDTAYLLPAELDVDSAHSSPKLAQSKVMGISVDITSRDLRPLKSPVRLIGSPSLLSASVQQHQQHLQSSSTLTPSRLNHEFEGGAVSSGKKRGFGRDKERRRRKEKDGLENIITSTTSAVGEDDLAVPPPFALKRSTSLESTTHENAQLLSLLRRSTTAALKNLDGQSDSLIDELLPKRAATSMGVAAPFQNRRAYGSDDDGSMDYGSMSAESMNTSMEFEPLSTGASVAPLQIKPLSNAPLSGFKHGDKDEGYKTTNHQGSLHTSSNTSATSKNNSNSNSNNNTNPSSPRQFDSSLDNSIDSVQENNASTMAALESMQLHKLDRETLRSTGKEKKKRSESDASTPSYISVKEDRRRRLTDPRTHSGPEEFDLLDSPLNTSLKSSSRHIPPLAPTTKNSDEYITPTQPENKGIVLTGHSGVVNHVSKFHTNLVISGGSDATVRIWNVQRGLCVGRCSDLAEGGHFASGEKQSAVTALTTVNSESGNNIVTGTENGYIRVWELGRSESGDANLQSKFHAHKGRITCLVSESDGGSDSINDGLPEPSLINSYPRLVSGGADRTVRLWDPRLRKPQVFLFKGHTDTVNALLLDSSRSCIVSGGRDQSVRIWDIRTGRQRCEKLEHFGSVNCLAISKENNGGDYLSSGRDGVICLWKRGSGEFVRSLRQGPNAKAVSCMSVKNGEGIDGGSRSVSGSSDGALRLWDHNRGKCLRVLSGHMGAVTATAWCAIPGHVVSGGMDGKVRMWDCRAGRCTQYIQAHSGGVTSLVVDRNWICSSSRDGSLRVWNTAAE
ncbi:hypothetical protein TrST_g10471 [Triparma strigata]|uniref:Uncharacterized protein n=1 Tax=Triparma strigata TaxID=1606541 RepID=A0A9W7F1I3_9STRA|nr:hypothetical protein TrST_g10471 [Triparma strigata]